MQCLIHFSEISLYDVLIQCIGFVAMALGIFSYQAKRRGTILLMQMLGSVLWSLQFFLLGAYTGMALNMVVILRNTLYAQRGRRMWADSILLPMGVMVAFIAAGLLAWESPLSLLPIVGMCFSTVSLYITNETKIRWLSLCVSPPWLIYDAMVGSIGGVCAEVFTIISIFVALWRYRPRKDAKP